MFLIFQKSEPQGAYKGMVLIKKGVYGFISCICVVIQQQQQQPMKMFNSNDDDDAGVTVTI